MFITFQLIYCPGLGPGLSNIQVRPPKKKNTFPASRYKCFPLKIKIKKNESCSIPLSLSLSLSFSSIFCDSSPTLIFQTGMTRERCHTKQKCEERFRKQLPLLEQSCSRASFGPEWKQTNLCYDYATQLEVLYQATLWTRTRRVVVEASRIPKQEFQVK